MISKLNRKKKMSLILGKNCGFIATPNEALVVTETGFYDFVNRGWKKITYDPPLKIDDNQSIFMDLENSELSTNLNGIFFYHVTCDKTGIATKLLEVYKLLYNLTDCALYSINRKTGNPDKKVKWVIKGKSYYLAGFKEKEDDNRRI
jgi:hypothetical protein